MAVGHYNKLDHDNNSSGRGLFKSLTNSGKMYSTCVTTIVTGGFTWAYCFETLKNYFRFENMC